MGGRPSNGSSGGSGDGGNSGSSGQGQIHEQYTNAVNSVVDCATLRFPATLGRPQADALRNVEEGDILPIVLRNGNVLEMHNNRGEWCGVITTPQMTNLADCINQGHDFVAAVTSLRGDVCNVTIQHA